MQALLQTVDLGISDVRPVKKREEVEDAELQVSCQSAPNVFEKKPGEHTHGMRYRSSFQRSFLSYNSCQKRHRA